MDCKLKLITNKIDDLLSVDLVDVAESSIFDNNNICGRVFSNKKYEAEINFSQKVDNIEFYINDKLRKSSYNNGKIYFCDENYLENRIFLNHFGYVSITIAIESEGKKYEFYSNYIDVAVKNNQSSEIVRQMIDYISKNSSKYLFEENSNIKDYADIKKSSNKDIYTEISMLENIVFEYEMNFKYFKTGAKYKINSNYMLDDFKKLKEVKCETIQYIISNPQQLKLVNYNTGIKYNKLNLIPKKILVDKKNKSYSIYENKVILGFLKYMYEAITNKIEEIDNYMIDSNIRKDTEYISLSNEIYYKLRFSMDKYKIKLREVRKKVQKLYFMYNKSLDCGEINLRNTPKPTYIFTSVQHYRKIYKVIKDWFESGNYDLRKERMILTFSEVSQIYEYYLLFKINNYIETKGYFKSNVGKFEYKFSKAVKYVNTKFENVFLFEKGDTNICVYYQPVIHCNPIFENNKIGLFRNNTMSQNGKNAEYYTPDYVIKIDGREETEYVILDAKWSTLENVKRYRFKEIVYKYIFSIDTISPSDRISGVCVINGLKNESNNEIVYNVFNSKFANRNRDLNPSAKIFTISPSINEDEQKQNFDILFSMI